MIYPATLDIKVLQNGTWGLILRAMQKVKPVTSLTVANGVPTFNVKCHKYTANTKVAFTPQAVPSLNYSDNTDPINASFTPPCGLETSLVYYVSATDLTDDSFKVSATAGGPPITVDDDIVGQLFVAEPLNLSGYTIDSDIYSQLTDEQVATFTCAFTEASEGLISILLSATTSSTLETGQYNYDVSFTSPGGERYYWLKGRMTVERTYSRN